MNPFDTRTSTRRAEPVGVPDTLAILVVGPSSWNSDITVRWKLPPERAPHTAAVQRASSPM